MTNLKWICPCDMCVSKHVCKYKEETERFLNEKNLNYTPETGDGPLVQIPGHLNVEVTCRYYCKPTLNPKSNTLKHMR